MIDEESLALKLGVKLLVKFDLKKLLINIKLVQLKQRKITHRLIFSVLIYEESAYQILLVCVHVCMFVLYHLPYFEYIYIYSINLPCSAFFLPFAHSFNNFYFVLLT